jgi:hypothetical protein
MSPQAASRQSPSHKGMALTAVATSKCRPSTQLTRSLHHTRRPLLDRPHAGRCMRVPPPLGPAQHSSRSRRSIASPSCHHTRSSRVHPHRYASHRCLTRYRVQMAVRGPTLSRLQSSCRRSRPPAVPSPASTPCLQRRRPLALIPVLASHVGSLPTQADHPPRHKQRQLRLDMKRQCRAGCTDCCTRRCMRWWHQTRLASARAHQLARSTLGVSLSVTLHLHRWPHPAGCCALAVTHVWMLCHHRRTTMTPECGRQVTVRSASALMHHGV